MILDCILIKIITVELLVSFYYYIRIIRIIY